MILTTVALLTVLLPLSEAQRSAPSGNYTPTFGECPQNVTFLRNASSGLNPSEASWRSTRQWQVKYALNDYLKNVGIPGFDVDKYIGILHNDPSKVPINGMSFSGGGIRAQMTELGLYRGMDARIPEAVAAKTGGLFQTLSYISGLSGGALTVSGLAVNGFQDFETLLANGNTNVTSATDQVENSIGKAELGFPVTWADIVGLSSVYNLAKPIPASAGSPLSWTWSGVTAQDAFKNGSIPLPILQDTEVVSQGPFSNPYQAPNFTVLTPLENDTTVYEITPFEFGSWKGRVQAFVDTKYLGTNFSAGQSAVGYCATGYDNALFLAGTSLNAMNLWYLEQISDGVAGQFAKRFIPYPTNEAQLAQEYAKNATTGLVEVFFELIAPDAFNVSATDFLYSTIPNPFIGWPGVNEYNAVAPYLQFVDGSEAGQNNPVWPMVQKERNVDFIIISDNAGELSNAWINGTSLIKTKNATTLAGLPFPKIPSVNTMLNLNHTSKPVFYGCNEPDVPLVLYIADAPYSAYTNLSFTDQELTTDQVRLLTKNGLYAISQNSNALAADWTTCVACASIWKSLDRVGMDKPDICNKCWDRYCWNGTVNDASPSFLAPYLYLNQSLSWDQWNRTVFAPLG